MKTLKMTATPKNPDVVDLLRSSVNNLEFDSTVSISKLLLTMNFAAEKIISLRKQNKRLYELLTTRKS